MVSTPLERAAVITGSETGQLCLWTTGASAGLLTPRVMLLGHTSPICWIACCLFERSDAVVSLCRAGLLNVWDPMDGRCLSSATMPILSTAMPTAAVLLPHLSHAVVGGECQQLVVMHLASMTSRSLLSLDGSWCRALCATHAASEASDVVHLLAFDADNTLRTWRLTLDGLCVVAASLASLALGGALQSHLPRAGFAMPSLAEEPRAVQFSADGHLLLWVGSHGDIQVICCSAEKGLGAQNPAGAQQELPMEGEIVPANFPKGRAIGKRIFHEDEENQLHKEEEATGVAVYEKQRLRRIPAGAAQCVGGWCAAQFAILRHGSAVLAWSPSAVHLYLVNRVDGSSSSKMEVAHCEQQLQEHLHELSFCGAIAHTRWLPAVTGGVEAFGRVADGTADVLVTASRRGGLHLCRVPTGGPGGEQVRQWRLLGSASLESGWPAPPASGQSRTARVTANALLALDGVPAVLLLGYADGSVGATTLPGGSDAVLGTTSHAARVTALLALRGSGLGDNFASASADGMCCVWSIGSPLAITPLKRFHEHCGAVRTLLQPPSGVAQQLASSFLSVGVDGAVAIYVYCEMAQRAPGGSEGRQNARSEGSVEPDEGTAGCALHVACLVVLSGHAEPVQELHWRTAEGMLCCRCALPGAVDSTLYIWQVPSGRLERVLSGVDARPHLAAMARAPLCQSVPDITPPRELRSSSSTRLLESVRLPLGGPNHPLHVMVFNIKRLAAEAKQRASSRDESYRAQLSAKPDGVQRVSAFASLALASIAGEQHQAGRSQAVHFPVDVAACQSALSYMTCWGVDSAFDKRCREEIGLCPPAPQIAFGVRGHGGNFSFLTPSAHTIQHRWRCSAHLTALHSVAAVALANTLMTCPGYDEVRNVCSGLVTHFSIVLPERLPLFCAPSLSLLARHYVDAAEEVQQAARALMEGTLLRMSAEVRRAVK